MKSSPRCAPLSELMKNPPSASIIEDLEDLYENAPCGYLSLDPRGRIFKVNKTLCDWIGYAPEQMLGKRLGDLLNIAGRMFYETHIAPLLRMQGFFNEVALDLVTQNGDRLPVIANAAERRAADIAPSYRKLNRCFFQSVNNARRRRLFRKIPPALSPWRRTI